MEQEQIPARWVIKNVTKQTGNNPELTIRTCYRRADGTIFKVDCSGPRGRHGFDRLGTRTMMIGTLREAWQPC